MSSISFVPTLFLMRHAHAAGPKPGERDIDRSLDATGRAEAEWVAANVRERGWSLGHVVCSTARRCRQTAEALLRDNPPASLTFSEDLYTGPLEQYAARIRAMTDDAPLTLIGHNPLIEKLVWEWLGAVQAAEALPAGFQPATLVALTKVPDRQHRQPFAVISP